jgi:hypothetical protein
MHHNSWIANLAIAFASLVLTLALVELGLRMTSFSYPSFYTADEITAHGFRPNSEGWFREEGESYVKINSDGWRDRLHTKKKPAGVKRIAVLGDSFASALHVPEETTFWSLMEKQLAECAAFGDEIVEVMNFGVTGFGTLQELLTLRYRVWDYSPDLVLLAFLSGNDLKDNVKSLAGEYPRPFVAKGNSGELRLDQSFIASPTYHIKTGWAWKTFLGASDYLKIFQLLNKAQAVLRDSERATTYQTYKTYQQNGIYTGEPGLDDNNIYADPKEAIWLDAWQVAEDLIVAMRDEVESRGARFVIVTLSNGIQVHPDPHTRKQFMERLGVSDLFYPERRLSALADRQHMDLVTLAPQLQSYAQQHVLFLHGFPNTYLGIGHWNEKGHEVAARILAEHLCPSSTTN